MSTRTESGPEKGACPTDNPESGTLHSSTVPRRQETSLRGVREATWCQYSQGLACLPQACHPGQAAEDIKETLPSCLMVPPVQPTPAWEWTSLARPPSIRGLQGWPWTVVENRGFRTRRGWAGVPQSWERVTLASGSTSLSLSFPLYKEDPESGPFYYQGEGPRGVRRVEPRPARRKRRRVSAMVTLTLAPSVPQANLGLSRVLQQTGEASPPSLLQPKC